MKCSEETTIKHMKLLSTCNCALFTLQKTAVLSCQKMASLTVDE